MAPPALNVVNTLPTLEGLVTAVTFTDQPPHTWQATRTSPELTLVNWASVLLYAALELQCRHRSSQSFRTERHFLSSAAKDEKHSAYFSKETFIPILCEDALLKSLALCIINSFFQRGV
jgi:hypothetical protein